MMGLATCVALEPVDMRLYPWIKNADGPNREASDVRRIAETHGVFIPDDSLS